MSARKPPAEKSKSEVRKQADRDASLADIAERFGFELRRVAPGFGYNPDLYVVYTKGRKAGLIWLPHKRSPVWNSQETITNRGVWPGVSFERACEKIAQAVAAEIPTPKFLNPSYVESFQ